jgi:hypothetical protein
MNIALEGTREFVDGKLRRSYGDAFVRGNNGMFCLSPSRMSFVFLTQCLFFLVATEATTSFSTSSLPARNHRSRVGKTD